MKISEDVLCIPWTTLLWHRRNSALAYILSWLTKPCTGMLHKYKLKKVLNKSKLIYLILQPGKVASKAVESFLTFSGVQEPIFHLHYLRASETSLEQHGPIGRDLLFPQMNHYDFLQDSLKAFLITGGQINIVCGIRDPWSRSRSAFLQNLASVLLYDSRSTFFKYPVSISLPKDDLVDLYHKFNHKFCTTWFDQVLFPLTGIDVYQCPFPIKKGFLVISEKNINIFLYRFDRLKDPDMTAALVRWLGSSVKTTDLPLINEVRSQRRDLYNLIKLFKLPETVSADFASCKLSRHFFSEEEIVKFSSNQFNA